LVTVRSAAKQYVLPAAVAAALAVAATGSAQDGGVARLEALGSALRRHTVWRAAYHQEYVPAGMSQGEEQAGTVWVGWPNRALFRAGNPAVRMLGLEGRQVRLVDGEAGTCDNHELTDEEWERVPLAAVLDPRRAADRFAVAAPEKRRIVLVPRAPGGVATVEVTVNSDGMPAEVVVVDPQGAVNRLRFTGWRSAKAPPGGWLPEPPAGVSCTGTE
jgi:hypothetical protein